MSTQGHYLNTLGSTRAHDAAYQVSLSSAFGFRTRRFVKVFTIYAHGGHLGHVTWTVWINIFPPFHKGSVWNLTLIGRVVSEKKMFQECGRRQTTETYLHHNLTFELKRIPSTSSLHNSNWNRQSSGGKSKHPYRWILYPVSTKIFKRTRNGLAAQ